MKADEKLHLQPEILSNNNSHNDDLKSHTHTHTHKQTPPANAISQKLPLELYICSDQEIVNFVLKENNRNAYRVFRFSLKPHTNTSKILTYFFNLKSSTDTSYYILLIFIFPPQRIVFLDKNTDSRTSTQTNTHEPCRLISNQRILYYNRTGNLRQLKDSSVRVGTEFYGGKQNMQQQNIYRFYLFIRESESEAESVPAVGT